MAESYKEIEKRSFHVQDQCRMLAAVALIPESGNVFNNEANDSVNNINHYYNDFEEERKTWQELVKAKDDIIAVKDAMIALLKR